MPGRVDVQTVQDRQQFDGARCKGKKAPLGMDDAGVNSHSQSSNYNCDERWASRPVVASEVIGTMRAAEHAARCVHSSNVQARLCRPRVQEGAEGALRRVRLADGERRQEILDVEAGERGVKHR